jgi:homopolymeric O-antigen transport system permease protein
LTSAQTAQSVSEHHTLVLKPRTGWRSVDFREMWEYRELLGFFVWRDVKVRYRQTALGIAWAVLQPLSAMLIFTVLFNRVGGIQSGTTTPYPLFAYSGLVAWTFFANAVAQASNSLVASGFLISKAYFPRAFIPIGSIGALLVDLLLGLTLVIALFIWYHWPVSANIVQLPLFILGAFLAAGGVGLVLSALSARFRDVKYVVPFLVQMWMFITPVIYPSSLMQRSRVLSRIMTVNPMSGMVNGFRHSLLGDPADWRLIGLAFVVSITLFVGGLYFFRRLEREFADIL